MRYIVGPEKKPPVAAGGQGQGRAIQFSKRKRQQRRLTQGWAHLEQGTLVRRKISTIGLHILQIAYKGADVENIYFLHVTGHFQWLLSVLSAQVFIGLISHHHYQRLIRQICLLHMVMVRREYCTSFFYQELKRGQKMLYIYKRVSSRLFLEGASSFKGNSIC